MTRGRKTKLTPELQNKICDAIRMGNYIETAAAYAGVNKTTLYDWLKRGARERERVEKNPSAKIKKSEAPFVEFSNAVEKALADAEVRDVLIIANAAKENWQAAAWRLERKFPERWGRKDKVQADVNHSGNMQVKQTHEHHYHILQEVIERHPELIDTVFGRRMENSSGEGTS